MDLKTYIQKHCKNASEFARALGVRPAAVSRWLSNDRRPSREQMIAIAKLTGLRVTPNDLLPEIYEK